MKVTFSYMSKIEKVKNLLEVYGKDDQRTSSWFAKRGQMLTASEIYKGLPDATPSQRHELIMSKLVPREQLSSGMGGRALIWGTQFEPIAKSVYEEFQYNIEIIDNVAWAIDKENIHSKKKLSELVGLDKELSELSQGRQQQGTGARQQQGNIQSGRLVKFTNAKDIDEVKEIV
jgi:hypothetical protein